MKKSIFYHAGCPVCTTAEHEIVNLIGADHVDIIHLGEEANKIADADRAGVKSVPALVTPGGHVFHLNFGAALSDLG